MNEADTPAIVPPTPTVLTVNPSNSNNKKKLFFIITAVLLLTGIIALLFYFQIITIGRKAPVSQVPANTKAVTINLPPDNPNLENCFIQKEGNPLVLNVQQDPEMIYGEISGNLNNISFDSETSAQLQMVSFQADQMHTYTLKYQEGLVYDGSELKNVPLKSLQKGQVLTISFNCFPKLPEDKQFRIARVVISQKR